MEANLPTNQRNLILRASRKFLERHYLIPFENKTSVFFFIKRVFVNAYFASIWICCLIFIIHNKRGDFDNNLDDVAADFTSTFVIWGGCTVIIAKNNRLQEVLSEMCKFGEFGKPLQLEIVEHRLQLLTQFTYYFIVAGVIVYGSVPLWEIDKCYEYKRKHNTNEICGLYTPIVLPFDIDYFPARQICFTLQIVGTLMGLPIGGVLGVTAFCLHEHMVLRLRHLKAHVTVISRRKITTRDIARLVRHHQYIIRTFDKINRLTSIPLCVHVFLTSTVITLITHQIFNLTWKTPAGSVMHVSGWIAILYANSLGGQNVMDESLSIGDHIYSTFRWHTLNKSIQKDLLLIIMRTQKPFQVMKGVYTYVMYQVST